MIFSFVSLFQTDVMPSQNLKNLILWESIQYLMIIRQVFRSLLIREEREIPNSVIALRFGEHVFRFSQPEMRCYVISSHTQVYEQAQRFLKTYAKNAELSEIRFGEDL